MFHSKEILTIATATVNKNKNTTATVSDKQIDIVLSDYKHLISLDYIAWYSKCIKKIGVNKFIILCGIAEEIGKDKPKYLSWLLKKEIT